MLIMLIYLSLFGYMTLLLRRLRLPAEQTPLVTVTSLIVVLYLAALLQQLRPAAYGLCFLGIAALGWTIYDVARARGGRAFLAECCTPGLLLFTGLFCLAALVYPHVSFYKWDELSYWGLVVKEMHLRDGLVYRDTLLRFLDYPTGAALWQYYFGKILGVSEGTACFAQVVLVLAGLTAFTTGLWKRQALFAVGVVGLGLVLLGLFFGSIRCLYVDHLVALLFGAGVAVALLGETDSPRALLKLVPILMVLPIIKAVGLLFAFALLALVIATRLMRAVPRRSTLAVYLLLLACPLFTHGLWQAYVHAHQLSPTWPVRYTLADTLRLYTASATPVEQETRAGFLDAMQSHPLTPFPPLCRPTAVQVLVGWLLLTAVMFARSKDRRTRRELLAASGVLAVFFVAYCTGMLELFIYNFTDYERLILASYCRYISIFLVGMLFIALVFFVREGRPRWRIAFLVPVLPLLLYAGLSGACREYILGTSPVLPAYRAAAQAVAARVREKIGATGPLYLIWQGIHGWEFYALRYELAPRITNAGDWNICRDAGSKDDPLCVVLPPAQFRARLLQEHIAYLVVAHTDAYLQSIIAPLLPPGTAPAEVYRVLTGPEGIRLAPVR